MHFYYVKITNILHQRLWKFCVFWICFFIIMIDKLINNCENFVSLDFFFIVMIDKLINNCENFVSLDFLFLFIVMIDKLSSMIYKCHVLHILFATKSPPHIKHKNTKSTKIQQSQNDEITLNPFQQHKPKWEGQSRWYEIKIQIGRSNLGLGF